MANTTHFYSHYDRTTYLSKSPFDPDIIVDVLEPGTLGEDVGLTINQYDILIDFGQQRKITHLFMKQTGMTEAWIQYGDYNKETNTFTQRQAQILQIPAADHNKRKIYTLTPQHVTLTDSAAVIRATEGSMVAIDTLIFMESLGDYPDGAFSEHDPGWEHRTQGHHLLASGRKIKYPGLGIPKMKLKFASEYIPYDYEEDIENESNPVPYVIGDEDIKKLENIFLNHRHFVVADTLDRHPERIFVASFENTEFVFPYSSAWKDQGHNFDIIVCEV